ncbi:uncharacterized protein N0V89_005389 [Didymosphaeria variabile]|uniref:Nephrocystin 3-like N-terminal domain-containing protein n=1 Tax=Didymosphaeria variabile TaxID=1932322 RepID=A0A9W8XLD7_9PLEO|nr:uncharacterized protein N0V89_005389 [Didymosphaeria variabile]KAJ4353659.1 hypothetical protein N0V89_005389 [Didymosphaeria variabile]
MFFGTPHGGSDPRGFLHHVAERLVKTIGFTYNKHVVNALLPSGERLKELRDEFGPLAEEQQWIIHSFQEQQGVAALGGAKVVEDTSSYLNLPAREVSEHIERNHMEMCRFTGTDDVEYRKVSRALLRMTQTEARSEEPSVQALRPLTDEHKQMLLESLNFEQLESRQRSIKEAHKKTCRWFLSTPEYKNWLALNELGEHNGFLWIKGKPGAGKSTLMKFASEKTRERLRGVTIISYLFNARGEVLEKSTIGAYRSLLLQLLQKIPSLHVVLDSLNAATQVISPIYQWDIAALKHLIKFAIQNLGSSSVICFIDALDECEEDQVHDMVLFLEHISEAIPKEKSFRVCLASRHYPHISVKHGLSLILEGHEGHEEDITNYLSNQLYIGHSKLAEAIRSEVHEKASGVFMWVVLVVGILNQEFQRGRIHALRRKLRELPKDLHKLFRDILTRDTNNMPELALCLQWVLFATKPLTPEQSYHAILAGVEKELSPWDPKEISVDDICRFLLDCSKGLTETTGPRSAKRVQFIHESVRDFLLKEDGFSTINSRWGANLHAQSYETLKNCCIISLTAASVQTAPFSQDIDHRESLWIHRYSTNSKPVQHRHSRRQETSGTHWPFLEHDARNVIFYADKAQASGVDQKAFLATFPLEVWIEYINNFEKHAIRRYDPASHLSLLYILAERNAAHLCNILDYIPAYVQVEMQRYGTPLLAALATDSLDVVKLFLEDEKAHRGRSHRLFQYYDEYMNNYSQDGYLKRDFVYVHDESVLLNLVRSHQGAMLQFLLETGRFDVDFDIDNDENLFLYALHNGQNGTGKQIFQYVSADTKSVLLDLAVAKNHWSFIKFILDGDSCAAHLLPRLLSQAITFDKARVVGLVLNHKNFDTANLFGDYSLYPESFLFDLVGKYPSETLRMIFRKGQLKTKLLEQLLCTESMWETTSNGYDNFGFHFNSELAWWMSDVIHPLVERDDMDINCRDAQGRTPLFLAAFFGKFRAVKLFTRLDQVDVNAPSEGGETPLMAALFSPCSQIVAKSLLATGKVNLKLKDSLGRDAFSIAASLRPGNLRADFIIEHNLPPPHLSDHLLTLKILYEAGKLTEHFDINSQDKCGRSPLLWACTDQPATRYSAKDRYEVVKFLLGIENILPDLADFSRRTPLSCAAENGYVEVAALLLGTDKVNVASKDSSGHTPRFYADQNKQTEMQTAIFRNYASHCTLSLGELTQSMELHVVFIDAGYANLEPFTAVSKYFSRRTSNTNVFGACFVAQGLAPLVKPGDTTVFTTSIAKPPWYSRHAYLRAASKVAVYSCMQTLSAELAYQSVRVNSVRLDDAAWGNEEGRGSGEGGIVSGVRDYVFDVFDGDLAVLEKMDDRMWLIGKAPRRFVQELL